MRGNPRAWRLYDQATQGSGVHFHPVDGRLVFVACMVIAVMVLVGWRVIAENCRCRCAE